MKQALTSSVLRYVYETEIINQGSRGKRYLSWPSYSSKVELEGNHYETNFNLSRANLLKHLLKKCL